MAKRKVSTSRKRRGGASPAVKKSHNKKREEELELPQEETKRKSPGLLKTKKRKVEEKDERSVLIAATVSQKAEEMSDSNKRVHATNTSSRGLELRFGEQEILALNGDDGKVLLAELNCDVFIGDSNDASVQVAWFEEDGKKEDEFYLSESQDFVPIGAFICSLSGWVDVSYPKGGMTVKLKSGARDFINEKLQKQLADDYDVGNDSDFGDDEFVKRTSEKKASKGKRGRADSDASVDESDDDEGDRMEGKGSSKKSKKEKKGGSGPKLDRLKTPRPDVKLIPDPFTKKTGKVERFEGDVERASKEVIRAVRSGDDKALEALLRDTNTIHSLLMPQSVDLPMNALGYALIQNDVEKMKSLHPDNKVRANLQDYQLQIPDSGKHTTGMGNYHKHRNVQGARGGKEGNGALLKDKDSSGYSKQSVPAISVYRYPETDELFYDVEACFLGMFDEINTDTWDAYRLLNSDREIWLEMDDLVSMGHMKLAHHVMKHEMGLGHSGYNYLHLESLQTVENHQDPENPFSKPIRTSSAIKKAAIGLRFTPIHAASINPDTAYLKALLAAYPGGTSVVDTKRRMVLHYAASSVSPEPLKFLLSRYPFLDRHSLDNKNISPLIIAAKAGRGDNVRALLDGVNEETKVLMLNHRDTRGFTALHYACMSRRSTRMETISALLELGADVNAQASAPRNKVAPIHIATTFGDLDVVRHLVEHENGKGINPGQRDKLKRNGAMLAARNGHIHVLSYLIQLGVDFDAADSSGNTPLHYAAAYGWDDSVQLLLKCGATPDPKNSWNTTPLSIAIEKNRYKVADILLKLDSVDVNFPDSNGSTMLISLVGAVAQQFSKVSPSPTPIPDENLLDDVPNSLKKLLDRKDLKVGITDVNGRNELHFLASCEYSSQLGARKSAALAQILIDRGSSITAVDSDGIQPLVLAAQKGNSSLFTLFMTANTGSWDALVNGEEQQFGGVDTLLHHTIKAKQSLPLLKLMDQTLPKVFKAQISVPNQDGLTPLLLAAEQVQKTYSDQDHGSLEAFFYILEKCSEEQRLFQGGTIMDIHNPSKLREQLENESNYLHKGIDKFENPYSTKYGQKTILHLILETNKIAHTKEIVEKLFAKVTKSEKEYLLNAKDSSGYLPFQYVLFQILPKHAYIKDEGSMDVLFDLLAMLAPKTKEAFSQPITIPFESITQSETFTYSEEADKTRVEEIKEILGKQRNSDLDRLLQDKYTDLMLERKRWATVKPTKTGMSRCPFTPKYPGTELVCRKVRAATYARLIEKFGMDIKSCRTSNQESVLHLAVKGDRVNLVRSLLINSDALQLLLDKDHDGALPIHLAVVQDNSYMFDLLAEKYDPAVLCQAQDGLGRNCLHLAIIKSVTREKQEMDPIETKLLNLEDAKILVTAQDCHGRTPLSYVFLGDIASTPLDFFPSTIPTPAKKQVNKLADCFEGLLTEDQVRALGDLGINTYDDVGLIDHSVLRKIGLPMYSQRNRVIQKARAIEIERMNGWESDRRSSKSSGPSPSPSADPVEMTIALVNCNDTGLNIADTNGRTALHYAAAVGAMVSSLLLVNRGARLDVHDIDGNSPLAVSILCKHDTYAIMMMKTKTGSLGDIATSHIVHEVQRTQTDDGSIEVTGKEVRSCMWHALNNDQSGLTYVLLDEFPYNLAIIDGLALGKFQMVLKLIKTAAVKSLVERDENGFTLLHHVGHVQQCDADWLLLLSKSLINRGVDAKATSKDGRTVLHCAAFRGHHEFCKFLCEEACLDAATKDLNGETALMWHLRNVGKVSMKFVSYLISKSNESLGGEMMITVTEDRDNSNNYAASISEDSGFTLHPGPNFDTVSEELKTKKTKKKKLKEANKSTSRTVKQPPSVLALKANNLLLLAFFARMEANLDALDEDGFAALHYAVVDGKMEMVQALIILGANVDVEAKDSKLTPLMLAIRAGSADIAKLLISHNASPLHTNQANGNTTLHDAILQNSQDAVELLVNAVGDVVSRTFKAPAKTDQTFSPDKPVLIQYGMQPIWYLTDMKSIDGEIKLPLVPGSESVWVAVDELPTRPWIVTEKDKFCKVLDFKTHKTLVQIAKEKMPHLADEGEINALLADYFGFEMKLLGQDHANLLKPLTRDQIVLVEQKDEPNLWYQGKITQANRNGTYDVQLVRGKCLKMIARRNLRPCPKEMALKTVHDDKKVKSFVNCENNDGKTPLDILARPFQFGSYENLDLAKKLILLGARVEPKTVNLTRPSSRLYKLFQSHCPVNNVNEMEVEEINTTTTNNAPTIDEDQLENDYQESLKKREALIMAKIVPPKVSNKCTLSRHRTAFVLPIENVAGEFYDVVLTKVDVAEWPHSENKFYEMQIVHDPIQNLYMLYTSWGRVGDRWGKFQNTPMGKQEVIKEFEKIFRSKSGNAFEDRKSFEPKPGKYRLVKRVHSSHGDVKLPHLVGVGKTSEAMDETPDCTLPKEVQGAFAQFTDRENIARATSHLGLDEERFPLGRISIETVLEAEKVLNDVESALVEHEKILQLPKPDMERLRDSLNLVGKLTCQFYELIPTKETDKELTPFTKDGSALKSAVSCIQELKQLSIASKLVLASDLQRTKTHPFDYCVNALGCSIEPLHSSQLERIAVEQYFRNTKENDDLFVNNVFKLDRANEPRNLKEFQNRRLLWHGTDTANIMGVLKNGLMIAPPEAPVTGHLYGKGIYCADMFAKAFAYSSELATCSQEGENASPKAYVLLVEMGLGNEFIVHKPTYMEKPPTGYQSTWAQGSTMPDAGKTIVLDDIGGGVGVPLGKTTEAPANEGTSNFVSTSSGESIHLNHEASGKIDEVLRDPSTEYPATVEVVHKDHVYKAIIENGPFATKLKLVPCHRHAGDESANDVEMQNHDGDNGAIEMRRQRAGKVRFGRRKYNEFIVYDTRQVKLRYIVEVSSQKWLEKHHK